MRRSTIVLALGLCLIGGAARAQDLEVRDVLWGFDGQVVTHRFAPLSVLIENTTEEAFSGALSLQSTLGAAGGRVGLRYEIPVTVAPDGRRWVQFYPYVDGNRAWVVSWGPNIAQQAALEAPSAGLPARVLLAPEDGVGLYKVRGVRTLDERLFPPSVTATDGLAGVLLDHDPAWDEDRRAAFMAWLARGGEVHILKRDDGVYPRFSGAMAALNTAEEGPRGDGQVFRHLGTRWQVEGRDLRAKKAPGYSVDAGARGGGGCDLEVLQALKGLNPRPRQNWTLILGLAFAYLLLLGPLNLLLARRVRSFLPLAFSLVVVAAFALLYRELGRRGYGERGLTQTLTYARQLPDGSLDLMQWSNIFTTVSERAEVGHAGGLNLYANGPTAEAVPGVTSAEGGGGLEVDIPLYSSRPLMHRGFLPDQEPLIKEVRRLYQEPGSRLRVEMTTGPGMPDKVYGVYAAVNGQLFQLNLDKDRISDLAYSMGSLDPWNTYRYLGPGWNYRARRERFDGAPPESWVENSYSIFTQALITRAVEADRDFKAPPRPDGRQVIDLFIYGRPKDAMKMRPESRAEVGAALYHVRLLETEE